MPGVAVAQKERGGKDGDDGGRTCCQAGRRFLARASERDREVEMDARAGEGRRFQFQEERDPPLFWGGARMTYLSILAPEDLESYMTLLCAGRRLDRGRLSQGSSTNDAPRSVVSNVPLLRRRGRDR